jgi:hypothetical protein
VGPPPPPPPPHSPPLVRTALHRVRPPQHIRVRNELARRPVPPAVPQMVRAGWWLNIMFAIAITLLMYSLVGLVFGVQAGVLPDWAILPG